MLPNGKRFLNLLGVDFVSPSVADIMTAKLGWEWFDSVREEEPYLELLARAQALSVV